MKKLILGMMLVIGSLSFSSQNDRGIGNHDFDQKLVVQVNQSDNASLLNDRLSFGISSKDRN